MNADVRLALMRAYSLAAESENQVIRHLLMYILSDGRVDGVPAYRRIHGNVLYY